MAPASYVYMLDFLKKTNEVKENFWALLIEPEWIISSIWQITDGKVEVISTSPATRWDSASDESDKSLVESIDTSLSACSQNLPDNMPDPSKTVFGVPNSWISDGNISEEYLEKLKKICTDLSLVPSGFVVLSEAISHYIKQEEEVSLSGIVVGISSKLLDLSIFNLGKLLGTTSVSRSISIEEDMFEGISRLSTELENLPPRIIIFNQKVQELEDIKNLLNDADWNKIGSSKFVHSPKVEILDPSKKILAVALAGGSELGDVTGVMENIEQEETSNVEVPEGVTAEDLGFSVGPNVAPVAQEVKNIPKFTFKKPNIKLPKFKFSLSSKPLIMIGSLIVTIFIVGFALWWILPKATVIIYVSPKKLEENISLKVDDDIKAEEVVASVNGEKSKSTTGTKTVGEKAKGSVKIQNGTAFPINLASGTILLTSSDLKFVTTKSASISGALSPSSPGVTTIDVEANSIGSEFNLNKDEIFKVANFPKAEVDGTSTDSFKGGSSKQISAVSEDDKKKLLKELKDELIIEATKKLSEKITPDMLLVEASFKEIIEEEDFSNKVGDEATNLKLSLALKVTSTVVNKKDLSEISKRSLDGKIPSGFVLRDDQVSYDFGTSDMDGQFDVKIIANLLPSIETTSLAKQITGKYPQLAEDFLKTIPGFVKAEIRLKPALSGKLGTLPHISKNINIELTSEK